MEMNNRLVLIGGGGHCKSILDTLLNNNLYSEIVIVDRKDNISKSILGVPIIGCDDDLLHLYQSGYTHAFITIGSVGDPSIRIKLYNLIKSIGFKIPNIIDSSAIISTHATLSECIYVGKNAVINAGSNIHNCAIINTGSIVEHDCVVGQFSHIAPGSVICGEVQIEQYVHVGARSVIKQQLKIGANTIIGMGSVVLKNISANCIAFGNPCIEVKSR